MRWDAASTIGRIPLEGKAMERLLTDELAAAKLGATTD